MKTQKFILGFFLLTLVFFTVPVFADVGPAYAVVHCTIVPVSGPAVEDGVIIIRDGLIESVGVFGKVTIPEDAEVIEAGGMYAYPGLISAHTNLLLEPPSPPSQAQGEAAPASQAEQEPGWQKAGLMALDSLSIKASTIEDLYKAGITTILIAPERNIFAGQSVLLNLRGENREAMVLKQPFGLHINFETARGEYPSSLMGTMALLRQSFLDTEHYFLHKEQFSKFPNGLKRPQYNAFLEHLLPYVVEKQPVIFNCRDQEDIKRAVRLTEEFDLNGYLSNAVEAWRVVDWIKKTKLPLLVSLGYAPPSSSKYVRQGEALKKEAEEKIYPANAANLYGDGVKFALTTLGLSRSADILKNLRTVIKAGFPEDEALKALTIYPAEYLGVESLVGTIESGKIANIVLVSGKIFEEKSVVQKIFVDGIHFEVKAPPKKESPTSLDISGGWKAVIEGPMGAMDMTIEFNQEGNQITGMFKTEMGDWDITDGVLSGSELNFTVSANIMGESVILEFSGTVEEDSLNGTLMFEGGSADLKATKIPDSGIKENGQ